MASESRMVATNRITRGGQQVKVQWVDDREVRIQWPDRDGEPKGGRAA